MTPVFSDLAPAPAKLLKMIIVIATLNAAVYIRFPVKSTM